MAHFVRRGYRENKKNDKRGERKVYEWRAHNASML
jgi:hypothetical protein